jgi:hypothetical protein
VSKCSIGHMDEHTGLAVGQDDANLRRVDARPVATGKETDAQNQQIAEEVKSDLWNSLERTSTER